MIYEPIYEHLPLPKELQNNLIISKKFNNAYIILGKIKVGNKDNSCFLYEGSKNSKSRPIYFASENEEKTWYFLNKIKKKKNVG